MACTKPKPCSTAAADAMENAGVVFSRSYCCEDCTKAVIARLYAVADLLGYDLIPQSPETSVQNEVDELLTQAQAFINDAQDYSENPCKVDPNKLLLGLEHILDAVRTMNRAQGLAAMAAVGAR